MRSQVLVIASYLASVVMILMILLYVASILPFTTAHVRVRTTMIDVYKLIESRSSWRAWELVEVLVQTYQFDYVNVTITSYNVLNSDAVIGRDNAVYLPVGVDPSSLVINRYSYSILYPSGIYTQYVVEVGYR